MEQNENGSFRRRRRSDRTHTPLAEQATEQRPREAEPAEAQDAPRKQTERPDARPRWLDQEEQWTDQIRVVHVEDLEEQIPRTHTSRERLASNLTIRLAATQAAMFSPFALFLLFAERKSRALRHYALQSVALTGVNLVFGLIVLGVCSLLGAIPLFGFVTRLAGWLVYLAMLIALLVLRVRLMQHAWHGYRWDVPVLGHWLQRFIRVKDY